jgi:hypothetical protein
MPRSEQVPYGVMDIGCFWKYFLGARQSATDRDNVRRAPRWRSTTIDQPARCPYALVPEEITRRKHA